MKHFLNSIITDLKQFSKTLDKKALLLNKPWALIDSDLGIQKLIFNSNKELILSRDGSAKVGKWEYYPHSRCILIDRITDKILCNEEYIDENVLILKRDGTKEDYIVLANQNNLPSLDAYKYLSDKAFEVLGIKYLCLQDNKIMLAKVNEYKQIGIGSEVILEGKRIFDGNYKIENGRFRYVIKNGVIVEIQQYFRVKIESGEYLMIQIGDNFLLEQKLVLGLSVFYYDDNKTDEVSGTFSILLNNTEAVLIVKGGIIIDCFYPVVYSINDDKTILIHQNQKNNISKNDTAFINNVYASDGRYRLGQITITVKNGHVTKMNSVISKFVLLLSISFIAIIAVILGVLQLRTL